MGVGRVLKGEALADPHLDRATTDRPENGGRGLVEVLPLRGVGRQARSGEEQAALGAEVPISTGGTGPEALP